MSLTLLPAESRPRARARDIAPIFQTRDPVPLIDRRLAPIPAEFRQGVAVKRPIEKIPRPGQAISAIPT